MTALGPGDEGTSVHLVTLDGRCMAGVATQCYPGGGISVECWPVSGMVTPNREFVWPYDPVPLATRITGYHNLVECPRRQPYVDRLGMRG